MRTPVISSLVLAAGLASLGCSSSNSPTGTGNNPANCSATVSGSVTASLTCTAVAAVWASASNTAGVAISIVGPPAVSVALDFSGQPSVTTYTNTASGALAGISVTQGTNVWLESQSSGTAVGTYSLALTSVGTAVTTSAGNSYTIHGTLNATLPALSGSGATGSVTLQITF